MNKFTIENKKNTYTYEVMKMRGVYHVIRSLPKESKANEKDCFCIIGSSKSKKDAYQCLENTYYFYVKNKYTMGVSSVEICVDETEAIKEERNNNKISKSRSRKCHPVYLDDKQTDYIQKTSFELGISKSGIISSIINANINRQKRRYKMYIEELRNVLKKRYKEETPTDSEG